MEHPVVAITGASGSIYGIRLLQALIEQRMEPYVLVSAAGQQVMALETGSGDLKDHLGTGGWRKENIKDFASPLASGSFRTSGMVIMPCSVGTVGAVASGVCTNLIHRAAEVCLKERRPLIIVPRETPLSSIALQNLLTLSQAGAAIVPASPGFYHDPKSVEDLVDFMVGRVLDLMNIPYKKSRRWTGLPVFESNDAFSD
ncbi:MAG: UbiX family flavin prenyltransferase [Candidatus Omnitrophica bacterium]|nr:UbiX family flavin prenyltransferase [Candidatus Omnitrophota bacterium]